MIDFQPYIGIPFKWRGHSFDGCDCWGLVRLFYREVYSIELPGNEDEINLAQTGQIKRADRWINHSGLEKTLLSTDGDILHMRGFSNGGNELHAGVRVDRALTLTTDEKQGSHIAHIAHKNYADRILGSYRPKDMTPNV